MKNWLGWRHRLASALVLVGMRDRLRCPACGAVGTWKPHGDPKVRPQGYEASAALSNFSAPKAEWDGEMGT